MLVCGQWQFAVGACGSSVRWWVLDEPTSAVDAETEEEIFARLKVAAVGRLVVLCPSCGRCAVLILW